MQQNATYCTVRLDRNSTDWVVNSLNDGAGGVEGIPPLLLESQVAHPLIDEDADVDEMG